MQDDIKSDSSPFSFSDGMNRNSQLMFALLPIVPPAMRFPLLLFSKIMECRECIQYKNRFLNEFTNDTTANQITDIEAVFDRIQPFLSEQNRAKYAEIKNIIQIMQMYNMMQSSQKNSSPDSNDNIFNDILHANGIDPEVFSAMQQSLQSSQNTSESKADDISANKESTYSE